MIFLKKLWLALSLTAFAALAVAPALAAAQVITTGNSGTVTTGNSFPVTSGNSGTVTTGNSAPNSVGGLQNPLSDGQGHSITGICQLMKVLLNIAILMGVPIAMLFIAYAGLKLVLARGNPGALAAARMNLMWTFIGIAIFLGVWFFVELLANTLGALGVQILGDCR